MMQCSICAILLYHPFNNASNIVQFKLDNVRIGDSSFEQAFAMYTTLHSPRQSRLETVVVGAR